MANCIFYFPKKSNQPEDGSYLEPKHVVERNNVRIYLNKTIELCLTIYGLYL
jgi:hypothetical protein